MQISYSQANDWRACQQLHDYRYRQRLESKLPDTAPQLGIMLHGYLEHFYRALAEGDPPDVAHNVALEQTRSTYEDELQGLANAAIAADQTDLAHDLLDLTDKTLRIAGHYYEARGRADAAEHRVIAVEQWLETKLTETITTPTRLDLLTEDSTGVLWLWEHKTSKDIPPSQRPLKDLQTLLVAVIVERELGIKPGGVMWNYIRTKEPTAPELLKRGGLTRRSNLDSTWLVYMQAITDNGLDPEDYQDMRDLLDGNEYESFYVRRDLPIMQREQILLRDFVTTAQQIEAAANLHDNFMPIRSVGRQCDWCSMRRLCDAAITGGDEDELKRTLFRVRPPRQAKEVPVGSSNDTFGD